MSNENILLRMLEPAVRPGNSPAKSPAKSNVFEDSSFEALLQNAQAQGANASSSSDVSNLKSLAAAGGDALSGASSDASSKKSCALPMQGVNHIENASLLELIAKHRSTSTTTDAANSTNAASTQKIVTSS